MPEGEKSQREEGRSSKKSLETGLQAAWSIHKQLQQRKIAESPSAVSEMDAVNPAHTPDRLPAGDNREDFNLVDVAEGVWGYLLPLNSQHGAHIALKNGNTRPIAETENPYEVGDLHYTDRNAVSIAGRYLIGRHPECDLHVNDPLVSNRHCLIFTENKNGRTIAVIEDLSNNGTFVNEAIVGRNRRRELNDRDEIIVLDGARFIFRYPNTIAKNNTFGRKYTIRQKIGKSFLSEVFSCVEKSTGQVYAVKVFTKNPGDHPLKTDSWQQEIAIFMGIDHPNILYAKDAFDEEDAVHLVLELAPGGELFDFITEKKKLTEEETRKIFIQLFQAVKYLHDRNIVDRDIKPENILLMDKKDLTIKLMDFGLSKILGHENTTTTLCGTPSYVAPEILTDSIHRRYTRAVDIWSLGVVLYICLCGFPPFSDELYSKENPYSLAEQIRAGRFDYPSPYWDSIGDPALDLIDQMLTVDPEKRYTIDECLEHSWMQNKTTSFSATLDTDDNLFGRLSSLNLSKRKVVRERTLLSSINDVKVIRVSEVAPHMALVKEHTKNLNSEATISLGGINRTRASADNQIEPPARLFRAPEDLGPQGSSGMSSRSSNVLGLSTDRDKTEVGPGHRGKRVLGGEALGDLEIGDLVDVPGSMHGTVKFIGTVDGKKGIFVGVELSKEFASRGKNNGDVDGISYFATSISKAGIFLPIDRATRRGSPSSHDGSFPITPTIPSIRGGIGAESNFITFVSTADNNSSETIPGLNIPRSMHSELENSLPAEFHASITMGSPEAHGQGQRSTAEINPESSKRHGPRNPSRPIDQQGPIVEDESIQQYRQGQNLEGGGQTNPLLPTAWSTFNRTESPPGDSAAAEFKKLQALDVPTNDKLGQEAQSIEPTTVEPPNSRSESLSPNPQNLLPSESSDLISTQGYQAKSLLDSSDDASASTDATDVSSPDLNVTYSDDEDGSSPLEEYDLGDRRPERRLIDPEGYFQELSDLENEVITNSGLEFLVKLKPSATKEPRAELFKPEADILLEGAIQTNTMIKERNRRHETIVNVFLRCGEIMECCCSNINRLQNAGFCTEYITVITEDQRRPTVAKLHKVTTLDIFELLEIFRAAPIEAGKRVPDRGVSLYRHIVLSCVELSSSMGMELYPPVTGSYFDQSTISRFTAEDESLLATLQTTIEALGLAVASYSGTHIRNFNQSNQSTGQEVFMLPAMDLKDEETKAAPIISFRRRRLMCMDAFLGNREVWVFQGGSDVSRNEPLWLATGIEELNDLWGPCWKSVRDAELDEIQSIEIGNGCILPWYNGYGHNPEDNQSSFLPPLDRDEVYSHWILSKDWDDAVVQKGQQGLERKHFIESSRFLIGASPYTGLAVNTSCKPSKADLVWKKTRLKEKNALRIPKTSYARRFKDSHSYQITANIPIAGSHAQALSYKRQEGLDRKSALIERWRNNSGNPGELEDFSGVEVSICTQNACRMRLLSILGSDTMRDYLHGISFAWPTKKFESDYFEAMKSRRKFRKFWNRHLSHSNKISSAVSICLDILQMTGVNQDNGELGALWVAEFEDKKYQYYSDDDDDDDDDESDDDMGDARSDSASRHALFREPMETRMPFKKVEEVIVTLFRSEYTWTGFLRDSPETITLAIVTSSCLEAIDDRTLGRRCKRGWWEDGKYVTVRGFPVIQTSLFVNEAILESSQLVSHRLPRRSRGCPSYRGWNTEGLQESSRFSLGDHGTLEVTVVPTECCPVTIMAWSDVKSSTWNEIKEVGFNEQLLGRSREPHHKEHISGVWEMQPLPVLIMSKSKKETIL